MAKIEFPIPLKQVLEDSQYQAPIRALADRVGEILADNKLPFFPDYTDHGIDHVNCVLQSEVELVPPEAWDAREQRSTRRVLRDSDAVVIIGATLLHDIGMHLRPDGFLELIAKQSRFRPRPWFDKSHEDHWADVPWHDVWMDYAREAQRFSERELGNIIGESSARTWKFHGLPEDTGRWERNHHLIVGEFIRRHHARLAHEIAMYGFPGLPVGAGESQFPAMDEQGHPLKRLADLIGLTARSHGTSLRVCKSYLDATPRYAGTPRPMDSAVVYPMALLRVADYLQIDRQRAPAVLLQLRNPQSPISVQEWKKHHAVENISPAAGPRAKMVTVADDLNLSLYLQLRDLLTGLQREMDHSTAVLDEVYGTRTELGLDRLSLATRRVESNLQSPDYRNSLPYVPSATGFAADPHLLTLLVEPLYGKYPSVGVRELIQNAADAVGELEAWCKARGQSAQSLDLPEQDSDVLVEFIKREDRSWILRVRDRGIGMTAETIQNYFLRAGASFRRSPEWAKEFLDDDGKPRVSRAGRFGVGAFAVFLLGPSFKLWTCHAGADAGYMIEASANSQLIEIKRVDGLQTGTTIEVEIGRDAARILGLESGERRQNQQTHSDEEGDDDDEEGDDDDDEEEGDNDDEDDYDQDEFLIRHFGRSYSKLQSTTDWFCWDRPSVVKRVLVYGRQEYLKQQYTCPIRGGTLPPEWSVIHPPGFEAVYWTFGSAPALSCNGLMIAKPSASAFSAASFDWPEDLDLRRPQVAILDGAANLPMTIQRYALAQRTLPFVNELVRDVALSFIAHALVCGPISPDEALAQRGKHPLSNISSLSDLLDREGLENCLAWCTTTEQMVPLDSWLYSLLNVGSLVVQGTIVPGNFASEAGVRVQVSSEILKPGLAALIAHDAYVIARIAGVSESREPVYPPELILERLARYGIAPLKRNFEACRVLVSATGGNAFRNRPPLRGSHGFNVWSEMPEKSSFGWWRFEIESGAFRPSVSLKAVIDPLEAGFSRREPYRGVIYAAEIKTKKITDAPMTLMAKLWNECLGARAIPYDPVARDELIAHGSRHLELKRHIETWKIWKEAKRAKNPVT